MTWKKHLVDGPEGKREVWKCQQGRPNFPGQICPYSVQVAEPWRPEHQERARDHRGEHDRIWHGAASVELRQAVDEAVLAEAERVLREASR